jgi:5-methylcytosine-specific restriction endonuclease McrA
MHRNEVGESSMSNNGVSYYELLKHPKWQRKRLEIMQAADFKCERCSADDITLNVHHTYHEKGKAPWEYPNTSLHCVCENCHKDGQDRYNLLQSQIAVLRLLR